MAAVRFRFFVAATMALMLAACTSSQTTAPTTTHPLPATDLSATPTGWVPIAYGDAQVSVPSSFSAFYLDSQCLSILRPGTVFVGGGPMPSDCNPADFVIQKSATLVHIHRLTRWSDSWTGETPMRLNGLLVYLGIGTDPFIGGYGSPSHLYDYIVPSLDAEVLVVGPLAHRIIDTLSRSPRDLALASGSTAPVPSSWQSVTFVGLRFSVPPGWPISRTQFTPWLGTICHTPGVAFSNTTVTLSTDMRPLLLPPCAYLQQIPQPPTSAVQVDSGLLAEPQVTLSFPTHCLDLHGLTACPATSPAYSILVLRVTVPGRAKPVFVSVGLAGSGGVARTILNSLRAA